MKRLKVIFLLLTFTLILSGCSISTKNNASPEKLLESNPDSDFFVIEGVVYINASDIEWIKELTLESYELTGKILKTGVTASFSNLSSTKLNKNIEIYSVKGREDILLAKVGKYYIPYLKWVEG